MKTAVLYGSSRGSTRRVVEKLSTWLTFPYVVFDVAKIQDADVITAYPLLLFFAPTYGDEELQEDMEELLKNCPPLALQHFAVCELGNYYGYDDFAFGAAHIMRSKLISLGAKEYLQPVSLDSLPKKNWKLLERWCLALNNAVAAHG